MNEGTPTLQDLLADGFTERFAREYLSILERERQCGMFDPAYLSWAHAHGFCAESACAYGLDEDNLGDYLSDYDYWRLWPLNGWERITRAGIEWFMIRWLSARNLLAFFCLIIIIINIVTSILK